MNRVQMRLGQAGVGLKELIATLVVSAILIIVGIYVFSKVKGSMSADLTGNASSAVAVVEKTAYDAFTLATVALIVLSAAVIIGILIRAFGA